MTVRELPRAQVALQRMVRKRRFSPKPGIFTSIPVRLRVRINRIIETGLKMAIDGRQMMMTNPFPNPLFDTQNSNSPRASVTSNRKTSGTSGSIFRTALVAAGFFLVASAMTGEIRGQFDKELLFDSIYLKNGSVLYGNATEFKQDKRTFYTVELADGGSVTLGRDQVKRVAEPPAEAAEYLQRRADMPDTVDAHWEMQEWCLEKRLSAQREYHLLQIIRLDPEHRDARSRLGHRQRNGVWMLEEHFYTSQGYVRDDRNWRLPQAIALSESHDVRETKIKTWKVDLRSWLKKYEKRQASVDELTTITDPYAVEALAELLDDEIRERPRCDEPLQRALLEALGGIRSYQAQSAIVKVAMLPLEYAKNVPPGSGDRYARDMRETCVRLLLQEHFDQKAVVTNVKPFLRPTETTPNFLVKLAAWLVGEIGDKTAVPALIDSLQTNHKLMVSPGGATMSVGEGPFGRGFSTGNGKPKFVVKTFQNQQCLDALRALTDGKDYGYNEEAWMDWYISTQSWGGDVLNRDD